MLHFIIGGAGSGKSEYAERLVAGRTGPTVYVGTLPHAPPYGETILRHRIRRPSSWHLIELLGNPETDIALLTSAMGKYQNILLDGFTFYVLQLITVFDFEVTALKHKSISLIREFANHSGEVVVVDQPVVGMNCARVRRVLCYLHLLLACSAHTVTLIKNRTAVPVERRELWSSYRLAEKRRRFAIVASHK